MALVNAYAPKGYTAATSAAAGLPLNPSDYPDFRLMYHPKRWTFYANEEGTGEWLPNLAPLYFTPGVACVDKDGDVSLAMAEKMRRGWIIVEPAAEYIAAYDGRQLPNGKVPTIYLPVWMVPTPLANEVRVKYDRDTHLDYLRGLVESGRLPPLDPDVIELIRGRVQDEYERDAGDGSGDGKAARRAEAAAATLAAMDATTPAKPAKAARRAKAAT
ncbi:hypothetical protein [Janthinobacterium sp.]|uniref:hypothetical protein n=1 Tax=Janthinobacterium sp. TaxID=1871054 RepID=UPI0025BFC33A|nr:hypothetical protein [Janthinobacterium sp.]NBV20155.1 hypothetical protein [Janthinobacterium sp.]